MWLLQGFVLEPAAGCNTHPYAVYQPEQLICTADFKITVQHFLAVARSTPRHGLTHVHLIYHCAKMACCLV